MGMGYDSSLANSPGQQPKQYPFVLSLSKHGYCYRKDEMLNQVQHDVNINRGWPVLNLIQESRSYKIGDALVSEWSGTGIRAAYS